MKTPPKIEASASFRAIEESRTSEESFETITPIEDSLLKLLESLGVSEKVRGMVASNDLTALDRTQSEKVCEWYAEKCGLESTDVCVIKIQGKSIAYVKASGIMRKARPLVQKIERREPTMLGSRIVTVMCTVTLKDSTSYTDVASRELTDARSIMACSTAATVRALRLAIGIPIPGEGE